MVVSSFGVRAACSERQKGDKEIQGILYRVPTIYRIVISFLTDPSERGFGGSFRTRLQILCSSCLQEMGSTLCPLPLNRGRLVTSLTAEYGGNNAM